MTTQFPYNRLPGVRRGAIRKASLWEGADHVFSVAGTRFTEQYRRFYYRDIQALVVRKCVRSGSIGVWLLTLTLCVIFALLGALATTVSRPVHFSFWIVSSLFLLFLIYRLVISLGYSCRCYIQTAVTWEELPSLYRIGNTQKALDRIRKKIAESQGTFAVDPQGLAEQIDNVPFSPPVQATSSGTETMEKFPVSAASMIWALLSCVALLVIAVLLFWHMDASGQYTAHTGFIAINVLLTSVAGAGFSFALVRIYKIRTLHVLRNFLFVVLALISIHIYFSTVLSKIYLRNDPISNALNASAFRQWFSLVDGSFNLLLGILGIILIVSNWQSHNKGPVSNL